MAFGAAGALGGLLGRAIERAGREASRELLVLRLNVQVEGELWQKALSQSIGLARRQGQLCPGVRKARRVARRC